MEQRNKESKSILLLSLEYLSPIFSGNGSYARCIVRGLIQQGFDVCIVSGRRENAPYDITDTPGTRIIDIPIPIEKYGRLDRTSAWNEFALGCSSDQVVTAVTKFFQDISQISVVMVVDWSAFPAWQALHGALQRSLKIDSKIDSYMFEWNLIRTCYLNFRVFTTSTDLHRPIETTKDEEESGGDLGFYQRAEVRALRGSTVSVALCRRDALHLLALSLGICPNSSNPIYSNKQSLQEVNLLDFPSQSLLADIRIVLPPLREDLATLAVTESSMLTNEWNNKRIGYEDPVVDKGIQRCLITSVVRLSREKSTHLFAQAIQDVSEYLQVRNIQPFLCGSAPDLVYATSVRSMIAAAHPSPLLVSAFLGPTDMAAIFSRSCINVHPALYDAYGMTIVEAAAMGAPSIVHSTQHDEKTSIAASLFDYTIKGSPTLFRDKIFGITGNEKIHTNDLLGRKLVELSHALPSVGALDLLAPDPFKMNDVAVFPIDLASSSENIAKQLKEILSDEQVLKRVSNLAREKALSWREVDNGKALASIARG
jgi:glycosyltransferase involved in cell wall biosynthesis